MDFISYIRTSIADMLSSQSTLKTQSFTLDASARLRVSSLTTLGDYKTLGADETLLLENVGTGTGAWSDNMYEMSVASGEYLIRRSKKSHPYLSGKSQQIELTCIGLSGEISIVAQNNGVDVFNFRQGRWNVNKLDGHDWSAFNVIIFDFLWLGGAVLRTFVVTKNGIELVDKREVAASVASLMFKSPNHPIRYEIRSDGTTTTKRIGYFSSNAVAPYDSNKDGVWIQSTSQSPTGSMHYVCSQVSTEGTIDESGKQGSTNTGSSAITAASIGTTYPLIAVRKKAGFRDRYVKVIGASAFISTNDTALLTVQLNPTLSAPLTYAPIANKAIDKATGDGVITVTNEGTILFSQVIAQDSTLPADVFDKDFLTVLGNDINDVSDQIVLCITPISVSVGVFGSINYKEY